MTFVLAGLLAVALIVLREQHARHAVQRREAATAAENDFAQLSQIIRDQADRHQALETAHQQERETWADRLAQPTPDLVEHVALIDRLCQRLQAPEQAVVEHQLAQPLPPMPQVVPFDDDAAYNELHELSKEQLAEQLAEAEIVA